MRMIDIIMEKQLERFERTLYKNNVNLDTFYYNVRSLEYEYVDDSELDKNIIALYDGLENKLKISYQGILDKSIPHELFHMASAVIVDNRALCVGFDETIIDTGEAIGVGLNEGFTELLCETYFNHCESYFIQKFYMQRIAELIDFKTIENCYMNSDLNSLVDELSIYDNYNNIINFIHGVDVYTTRELYGIYSHKEAQDNITMCSNILVEWYEKKIKQENKSLKLIDDFADKFKLKIIDNETKDEIVLSPKKLIR